MLEDLLDESTYPEEWQQLRREEAELTNRYTELQEEQHGIERLRRQYHRWQNVDQGGIPRHYVDQGDIRYFERTQGPRLIELEREMAHIDQRLEQIRARLDTLGEEIERHYMETGGHSRREGAKGKFKRHRFYAPGPFGPDPHNLPDQRLYKDDGSPLYDFNDLNYKSARNHPPGPWEPLQHRVDALYLYDEFHNLCNTHPMAASWYSNLLSALPMGHRLNFQTAWTDATRMNPQRLGRGDTNAIHSVGLVASLMNMASANLGQPEPFRSDVVARLNVIPVPTVPGPSDMTLGEVQDIQNTNIVGHASGRYKRRRFYAPGHFGADPRIYNEHGEPTEIDSFTGKPIPLDLNLPSSRITPDARHLGLQLYDALMVQIHSNPMLSADAMRILKPWEQTNFEQAWESVNEPEFPEKLASGPSDLWGKDLWRVLAVVNDVQRVMGKPPLFPPEAVARLASGLHGGPGSVPTFRNIQQAQLTGAVNNPQKRDPEDWALERMSRPQAGGHYGGKKIKFHNEHGKKVSVSVVAIPETAGATVRMTLQGPHSTMVNDITLMEARYLHKALSEFLQGNTEFAARAPHR